MIESPESLKPGPQTWWPRECVSHTCVWLLSSWKTLHLPGSHRSLLS